MNSTTKDSAATRVHTLRSAWLTPEPCVTSAQCDSAKPQAFSSHYPRVPGTGQPTWEWCSACWAKNSTKKRKDHKYGPPNTCTPPKAAHARASEAPVSVSVDKDILLHAAFQKTYQRRGKSPCGTCAGNPLELFIGFLCTQQEHSLHWNSSFSCMSMSFCKKPNINIEHATSNIQHLP
eukprot:9493793-Pyramimonas_sp.AAC.1